MNALNTTIANPATGIGRDLRMSSVEIAELTGKRHDNVLRDIRVMLEELGESLLKFEDSQRNAKNGQRHLVFRLPKRETLILVSGYSVHLRAKIIDRWTELEALAAQPINTSFAIPQNLAEALRFAADQTERLEQQRAELVAAAPKLAALDRLTEAYGALCLRDAAKAIQVAPKKFVAELQARGWIYRGGNGGLLGYQTHVDRGLITHRANVYEHHASGEMRVSDQVLITAKGLTRLAAIFATEGAP